MSNSELVLVLHGLGNSRSIMSALSWHLKRNGFTILNLGYPSCQAALENLSQRISEILHQEWDKGQVKSVSIVGFSLGSQLARLIIDQNADKINFSRLVMLAPPNQGSSLARFLRTWIPTDRIWGPVFNQLCQHNLPNPCSLLEVGIIAGGSGYRLGVNPFFNQDNDGLVTVAETRLEGARAHKVIFAPHGLMPLQPRVMRMTANFLKTGSF